ncbi:hypothetical protein N7492_002224 [Penicillium capsulatum]|uniref:Uncharacterized protein n=1 Tax=Penicillium capsulatum TaxID=69766 RepID=A0A9W9IJM6_9EURO|nr:hypothetical protein N7492_002224 [Penicillium capsulatum]KAJ6123169.1 hypothetical protein N7512_005634 [Penicillium capsulatum]
MSLTLDQINAILDKMRIESRIRLEVTRRTARYAIACQRVKDRLGYLDTDAAEIEYWTCVRDYDDMQILHECHAILSWPDSFCPKLSWCMYDLLARYLPALAPTEMIDQANSVLRWRRLAHGMFGTDQDQVQCVICLEAAGIGSRVIELEFY